MEEGGQGGRSDQHGKATDCVGADACRAALYAGEGGGAAHEA